MIKYISFYVKVVVISFSSSTTYAAAINFDDIVGNGVSWSSDRYLASDEVQFIGGSGLFAWDDPSPLYGGENVATSGLTYVYSGSESLANSSITVKFFDSGNLANLGVTNFVQFDVVDYAAETSALWSYSAFDVNGSTILSGTGSGSGVTVQLSTSSNLIHGFIFNPSSDTDGLDTLVFNQVTMSAVPVPAAIWLFGSGLIVLTGFKKRKSLST